jgi:16S rRNA (adenine1518-N6/adenine1519-N6)-dimethyltransferase
VNLLGETKLILKRYKIKPKESLGQRFIVDEEVIGRQVRYAGLTGRDTVLEIGAGIGTLTKALLEKAKKVYVVEKDPAMIKVLEERFREGELEILRGDVLKMELPRFHKTVSNIPYSISSPLTFKLLRRGFERAVLTYQKEFAERMTAKPGTREYSRLSVATYYYAEAEVLEVLPPEAFYPKPKVDSAILRLTPKDRPFKVNEKLFFKMLRGLFIHRGKTVKNAMQHSFREIFDREMKGRHEIEETFPRRLLEKRVFQLYPEEVAEICNLM